MAKPLPIIGGPVYHDSDYWFIRYSHGRLLQSFSVSSKTVASLRFNSLANVGCPKNSKGPWPWTGILGNASVLHEELVYTFSNRPEIMCLDRHKV